MGQFIDLYAKVKRYYVFTPSELRGFLIATFILAFIISFNEWGPGNSFNFTLGIFNYLNAIIIVALSLFVHISVQRIWALGTGYRAEWKPWMFGLLFGLVVVFLTNGKLWLILPGGILIHHLAGHRLGWFRYDVNYWALAVIAVSGTYATIMLAILLKAFSGVIGSALLQKAIMFNILYALYNLLPISPLNGSRTMYGSRMLYAYSTAAIGAAAILLFVDIPLLIAVPLAFLIAITLWILYYIFFERVWWEGV